VVVKTIRGGYVAVVEVFDVDGVGWISVGSTVTVSLLAALNLVAEDGAGTAVSGSTALVVEAALEPLGKPGTLSITDPPFADVNLPILCTGRASSSEFGRGISICPDRALGDLRVPSLHKHRETLTRRSEFQARPQGRRATRGSCGKGKSASIPSPSSFGLSVTEFPEIDILSLSLNKPDTNHVLQTLGIKILCVE
jgi:hypothetical protein